MFITPNGSEAIQAAVTAKFGDGVKFGTIISYNNKLDQGYECAIGGSTFSIKDQLKAAGFRFDGNTKTWYLPGGYKAMRTFLGIEG